MGKKFDNKYYLKVSEYDYNNRLFLGIFCPNGDIHAVVTINLPEIPLKHDNRIFLDGSLSKHTKDKLIASKIISKPKEVQQYNMGRYEIADIDFDVLKEYDSKGVEEYLNNHSNKKSESFKQYSKKETTDLLEKNTRLVYVFDEEDELIVRYKDLPDVLVDFNDRFGLTNLRVCDYKNPSLEPLLTTIGYFLDRCDRKVRSDIIDRLMDLQTGEKKS